MENYQYKAFISYRHTSVDQDIAKRLHTLLENYKIPSTLKKSLGISKIGRIFRDNEELPLSADLGEDIHKALKNSEWLICVCSPRFIESKWCSEEVNYFLSLGRRDRILTILVEGEPQDAFPEVLRFVTIDGERIEKEPLAADVRASSIKESLKKLESEKLRLLAPILGVNFDDLKQRARKRRIKIITTIITAAFLLLSSFLAYAIIKNNQITKERNDSLIAESKWLAKSSFEELENNNPTLAVELALEALPSKELDRPVVDDAVNALYSAMFLKSHDNYETLYTISTDTLGGHKYENILFSCNENNLYLYREDCSAIAEYDLFSGKYKGPIDETKTSNSYYTYYNRRKELTDESIENKELFKGYKLYSYISDYKKCYSENKLNKHDYENILITEFNYGNAYGETGFEIIHEVGDKEIIHTYKPNKEYDWYHYSEDYKYLGPLYSICGFGSSYDDRIVYLLNGYDLFIFEASSEKIIKTINYKDVDGYNFCGGDISNDLPLIAFITTGGKGYVYNYIEDNIIELENKEHTVDSVKFNSDGTRILALSKTTNTCDIYSSKTGEMILSYSADFKIERVDYGFKNADFSTKYDNYIILGSQDYVQVMKNGEKSSNGAVTVVADAYVRSWFVDPILNSDGSILWSINNVNDAVPASEWDYRLYGNIVKTGEIIYNYSTDYMMDGFEKVDNYLLNYGKIDNKACLRIYDIDSGELFNEIKPDFVEYDKNISECIVRKAYFNEDKTLLYLFASDGNNNKSIRFVAMFDAKTGEHLWHKALLNNYVEYFTYMTNYNHFIDNNVFRIDYSRKSIYYDARTGEEIEYVEDVKKNIDNSVEEKKYFFNDHEVEIENNSLIDTETGEQMLYFGKNIEIIDSSQDGKKLLIVYYDSDPDEANIKGELFIINSLSVDKLISEAHIILGDNSLNNEQRKTYFLDN